MGGDAPVYAPPAPLALVHVERTFAAPRERVFRAWTDPEAVSRWFGIEVPWPPSVEADLRVGGEYSITWVAPDGQRGGLSGTYLEVDPPARLVYTFAWGGMLTNAGGAANSKVTVEFRERGERTEVRLTHELLDTEPILAFHRSGWDTSLERLAKLL